MNEIAREKLALAFASIGMGIALAIMGHFLLTIGYKWGLAVLCSTPMLFWVSGQLFSHALYPEMPEEQLTKPEATTNGLSSTPNQ